MTAPDSLARSVSALNELPAADRDWVLAQLPAAQRDEVAELLVAWTATETLAAGRSERTPASSMVEQRLRLYVSALTPTLADRVIAAAPPAWAAKLLTARPAEESRAAAPAWGSKAPGALWAIVLERAQSLPLSTTASPRRRWSWRRSA